VSLPFMEFRYSIENKAKINEIMRYSYR
jgi:hypothetical protein